MATYEAVFVWLSIGLYGIASALYISGYAFGKERILNGAVWPVAAAFVAQTAAIGARYLAVGNLPWSGDYEDALAGTWFIIILTLFISRQRTLRGVGVGTVPLSLLLLGYGVMRTPQLTPMTVSLKSYWLVVHVLFAWLAFGSYVIAFGLAVMYLLKRKSSGEDDLARLDDLMFRYLVFGFITDAVMIATGAIWARDLWGNYWSWDPVETWSLVTWLTYGMAVHLRVTMGWRGHRFARLLIFALPGIIVTYFGITFLVHSSLHVFNVQPVGP